MHRLQALEIAGGDADGSFEMLVPRFHNHEIIHNSYSCTKRSNNIFLDIFFYQWPIYGY
jgi:hypothetical protein